MKVKTIKTRKIVKDIKLLDKSTILSTRMKNAYIRTKKMAEETRKPRENSPTEYANDNVQETAQEIAYNLPKLLEKARQNFKLAKRHLGEVKRQLPKERQYTAEKAPNTAHNAKTNAEQLKKTANQAKETTHEAKKAVRIAKRTLKDVQQTKRQTIQNVKQNTKHEMISDINIPKTDMPISHTKTSKESLRNMVNPPNHLNNASQAPQYRVKTTKSIRANNFSKMKKRRLNPRISDVKLQNGNKPQNHTISQKSIVLASDKSVNSTAKASTPIDVPTNNISKSSVPRPNHLNKSTKISKNTHTTAKNIDSTMTDFMPQSNNNRGDCYGFSLKKSHNVTPARTSLLTQAPEESSGVFTRLSPQKCPSNRAFPVPRIKNFKETSKGTIIANSLFIDYQKNNTNGEFAYSAPLKENSQIVNDKLKRYKTAKKSIKTAERTVKTTVKTVQHTAKTTQETAKTAVKSAKASKKTARAAGKVSIRATKVAAKTIIAMTKAAIAAINGLIALIVAGGWVVVAIILIICMIAMLVSSVFGIFFSNEPNPESGMMLGSVIGEINTEYTNKIDEIISANEHDTLNISGARASWKNVLAVYTIKIVQDPNNPMEAAIMDDAKADILRTIFWDMNTITHWIESVRHTETYTDASGNIRIEVWYEHILHITISHKKPDEMAEFYDFTNDQKEWLEELFKPEYNSLWNALLYGIPSAGDGSVIEIAITQLGNIGGEIYWSWYGFSNRVSWCACFVSWVAEQCGYIEAEIIPRFALCDDGIKWFKERGQWQNNTYTPAPGDIIFFDWDSDGSSDHVGFVEFIENNTVYTIEGNTNDSTARREYPLNSQKIMGYGIPLY